MVWILVLITQKIKKISLRNILKEKNGYRRKQIKQ